MPFYSHEVVKQALVEAIERPAAAATLLKLLKGLLDAGCVSEDQLAKGVARVRGALPDLKLDNPHAEDRLGALLKGLRA